MTLVSVILAMIVVIVALYAFRILSTPYLDAFRFAFYLFLVLLGLSVWYGVMDHPYDAYDPTVGAR
jgi:hypothetical protein